jgi:hypothetical protein
LSLAGQVTVPACGSMRNRSLGSAPAGAVGAATLVIAVTPCWARSASSACAIATSPALAAPTSAAQMTSLSGSMATWPL